MVAAGLVEVVFAENGLEPSLFLALTEKLYWVLKSNVRLCELTVISNTLSYALAELSRYRRSYAVAPLTASQPMLATFSSHNTTGGVGVSGTLADGLLDWRWFPRDDPA